MAGQAEVWSFPTDRAKFDDDDRISFSKLDNKYIAVQSDGTEYEFDADLRRWLPVADEALIQAQQRGYGAADDDDSYEPRTHGQKRKMDSNDREDPSSRPKPNKRHAGRQAPQPKQNTAIYVTGLPVDVTVDEVAEHFSRKCGVIAEEIDSGRPRIKLYTDGDGQFKGDALIVFFKPQSVEMAIMLLDDTDFRFTPSGLSSGKIRVQAADSSYKKTNYEADDGAKAKADNGEASGLQAYDKKPHRQRSEDKAKIIKKTQKLAARLADWDDDEPAYLDTKGGKWEKLVILSHMFTLEELEEDPAALLDIKEDIREECAKLGEVTNVVLYDLEPEGIVSVKFRTAEAAKLCVDRMHGRAFDGRTVEAFFATGREKFQRSKKDGNGENQEDDSD